MYFLCKLRKRKVSIVLFVRTFDFLKINGIISYNNKIILLNIKIIGGLRSYVRGENEK